MHHLKLWEAGDSEDMTTDYTCILASGREEVFSISLKQRDQLTFASWSTFKSACALRSKEAYSNHAKLESLSILFKRSYGDISVYYSMLKNI